MSEPTSLEDENNRLKGALFHIMQQHVCITPGFYTFSKEALMARDAYLGKYVGRNWPCED